MTDEPVRLDPLDPAADAGRFDALIARIVADGMAARATRPAGAESLAVLAHWSRPVLAAAAAVAVLATGTLATWRRPATVPHSPLEALGIPAPLAAWAAENRIPELGELLAGIPAPVIAGTDSAGAGR